MTLFYRNLSLGQDLPRRIDLLSVKMYIFSTLLCQVYFSLLLKLTFCKCSLVQWVCLRTMLDFIFGCCARFPGHFWQQSAAERVLAKMCQEAILVLQN